MLPFCLPNRPELFIQWLNVDCTSYFRFENVLYCQNGMKQILSHSKNVWADFRVEFTMQKCCGKQILLGRCWKRPHSNIIFSVREKRKSGIDKVNQTCSLVQSSKAFDLTSKFWYVIFVKQKTMANKPDAFPQNRWHENLPIRFSECVILLLDRNMETEMMVFLHDAGGKMYQCVVVTLWALLWYEQFN